MGFWEILILGVLIYGIYKWGDKAAENYMKKARDPENQRYEREQAERNRQWNPVVYK